MKEIILATNNSGKIKELEALLAPIQCIPQHSLGISEAEETGLSFIENAILKARHASRQTGKPSLADDSGLVVPALNGEPGIYSARFAGPNASDEDNVQMLLNKLKHVPEYERQAYFYCAMVLVEHADDPTPIVATGKLEGVILDEPKGSSGFGYDPIFFLPSYGATVAELSKDIKNQISHRAQALNALLQGMLDYQ
ncbi:RdgB/HAM1 family non-canonical purine NTP pyrophosphatase [Legionella impletisoli]|uniref:dITP/XTP pyrophosphatase n=1 Tax=Legionella impletisoli TaxID=343510 RepID=A0A917NCF3_9GAMM|nr:RdgB/HAM1 family non-canonical purine NTP pyrophosphatase [Legionella impletisoli]GGI88155.1 non-canonical purine NTP pyrophosphatase [Legionella impletisoli]